MTNELNECRNLLVEMSETEYPSAYNLFEFNSLQYPLLFENILSLACDVFSQLAQAEQAALRCNGGSDLSDYFVVYAARLATEAARRHDKDFVAKGIVALLLANRNDIRENLAVISILRDASHRAGVDFQDHMDQAKRLATGNQRKMMDAFQQRSHAMQSLSAFGWTVHGNGSDLTYVFE